MKYIKSLMLVTMLTSCASIFTWNIGTGLENCGAVAAEFGENLWQDTTTQLTTAGAVIATYGAYTYYDQKASMQCLDGHFNGRILQKSKLIYVNYADFLTIIESLDSYAQALEFISQYCSPCYMRSQDKINKFIALAQDLQKNNSKHLQDDQAAQDNMILENFKNQLILVQQNIEQEDLNAAINSATNANNMYTARVALDFFQALTRMISNKQ